MYAKLMMRSCSLLLLFWLFAQSPQCSARPKMLMPTCGPALSRLLRSACPRYTWKNVGDDVCCIQACRRKELRTQCQSWFDRVSEGSHGLDATSAIPSSDGRRLPVEDAAAVTEREGLHAEEGPDGLNLSKRGGIVSEPSYAFSQQEAFPAGVQNRPGFLTSRRSRREARGRVLKPRSQRQYFLQSESSTGFAADNTEVINANRSRDYIERRQETRLSFLSD